MVRINSIEEIFNANVAAEFKEFLLTKFSGIIEEYGLSDICDVFSVIVLEKCEADYFSDKYLEFSEEMTLDGIRFIHTVWAASDGYSEDIYIPYSNEAKSAIEERCM